MKVLIDNLEYECTHFEDTITLHNFITKRRIHIYFKNSIKNEMDKIQEKLSLINKIIIISNDERKSLDINIENYEDAFYDEVNDILIITLSLK